MGTLISMDDLKIDCLCKKKFGNKLKGFFYKGVLLFESSITEKDKYKYSISIVDKLDTKEYVTIELVDEFKDKYEYGKFKSIEEVKSWLKNPKQLYNWGFD